MGWGNENCSNGPSHMTKIAAMPVYGKNLKKTFFSGTKRPMTLNFGMHHRVLEYYQVCSNDDPGLTLTYFMASLNLVPYAYVWQKGKKSGFFRNYCRLLDCRPDGHTLPHPLGNFAEIPYLKEQFFLHRIRDVCTL